MLLLRDIVLDKFIWYTLTNFFVLLFVFVFLRHRFDKKISAGICCYSFTLIIVLDYIYFIALNEIYVWIYYLITLTEMIIVQITALYLSQYRDGRGLFTGMVASNVVLPGYFAFSIIYYFFPEEPFAPAIGLAAVDLILIIVMRIVMYKDYHQLQRQSKRGWMLLCLVPLCFYLLFYFLISMPLNILEKPEDFPAAFAAIITMLISYIVVIRYVRQSYDDLTTEWQLALIDNYSKSLAREALAVQEEQKKISIIRHDMRHYYSMLSVMITEDDREGLKQVLDEMPIIVDKTKSVQFCEDPVLNSVFQAASANADTHGVELRTSIILPKLEQNIPVELCAVVANLVENAIIASSEIPESIDTEKHVDVLIKPVKQQLFLEVKNPHYSDITLDMQTKLPISMRDETHGFGLQSVKEFTEHNGGAFDIEYSAHTFIARLTITLENAILQNDVSEHDLDEL